jgi:hypothetical protein
MARFIIDIQTRGFTQAKRNLADVTKQSRSYSRSANNAGTATAVMRKEVSQLRNNLLLYTFAIGGVISALGSFVRASSDATEEQDKFNIVFGDFGKEALKFAGHIQSSFGIAKSEMVGLMAKLQDTFVPLGFSREQASELSIAMAQLALDVGSLQNRMTSEVAARFTSAIVGNHEAVRELGISITEATLKTEAMRLGLAEVGEELTQEQKLLSRMSLISRGSADAANNLTITQKEFANQLRGTQGRLKTLREEIGDMIIPFAQIGLSMINFMSNTRRAGILLAGLTSALVLYTASAIRAAYAQWALNRAITGNVIIAGITALAMAIELATSAWRNYGKEAEEVADPVADLDALVRKFADGTLDLSEGTNAAADAAAKLKEKLQEEAEALMKSETAYAVRLATMLEDTELGKARVTAYLAENRMLSANEIATLEQIDAILAKREADKEAEKATKERLKAEEKAFKAAAKVEEKRVSDNLAALKKQEAAREKFLKDQQSAMEVIFQDNFDFQIGLIETQADRFIALEMDQVAVKEWAEGEKLKLAMDRFEQENELMSIFGGAYNTFINSLTDTAMNGADRYDRVMEAMQSSVIKFFADLVVQAIKNEIAMHAVKKASDSAAIAQSAVTGTAIASNMATAAAMMSVATGGTAAITGGAALATTVIGAQTLALPGFAEGGDFITSGPQMIMVGDNPGGREHVQVTPIGSPGPDAPSGGNITVNINAPLIDDTVVDSIIPAIERAKRLNLA